MWHRIESLFFIDPPGTLHASGLFFCSNFSIVEGDRNLCRETKMADHGWYKRRIRPRKKIAVIIARLGALLAIGALFLLVAVL